MSAVHIWNSGHRNAKLLYTEITVVKSTDYSFFVGMNWDKDGVGVGGGYFGLREEDKGERFIHFSVWDSNENKTLLVPIKERARIIDPHERIKFGRFENEGTGIKSILSYPWREHIPYRLIITATIMDSWILYSAYFFFLEFNRWERIASIEVPNKAGNTFGGYMSWIEDFESPTGINMSYREAVFSNGWNLQPDGNWIPIVQAEFPDHENYVDVGSTGDGFVLKIGGNTQNRTTKTGAFIDLLSSNRIPPQDIPYHLFY